MKHSYSTHAVKAGFLANLILRGIFCIASSGYGQQFRVVVEDDELEVNFDDPESELTFVLSIVNQSDEVSPIEWSGPGSVEYSDSLGRMWPPFRTSGSIDLPVDCAWPFFVTYYGQDEQYIEVVFTSLLDARITHAASLIVHGLVGVRMDEPALPNTSILITSFPNPFNSSTTISYSLPRPGRYALSVVDLTGREVARLSNGWIEAGSYSSVWNAGNLAAGQYVIRIDLPHQSASQPITLIK